MNKILFSITLLFSGSLFSQININPSDLPQIGNQIIYNQVFNIIGINIGNPGGNQVYDFSTLTSNLNDTVTYTSPTTTPFTNQFVNSNLASYTFSDSSYIYFNKTTSQLNVNGMILPSPLDGANLIVKATNQLIQLETPADFSSSFNSVGDFLSNSTYFYQEVSASPLSYFDSVRVSVKITRSSIIDGWGEMKTPFGYSIPVLRQKIYDITAITPEFNMFMEVVPGFVFPLGYQKIPGTEMNDTTTSYIFLTNTDTNYPLVVAQFDANSNENITSAKYAKLPAAFVTELNSHPNIIFYPNPSENEISFFSNEKINSIEIHSLDGKLIKKQLVNSLDSEISIENLNSGNYIAKIYTDKGISTKKITKK